MDETTQPAGGDPRDWSDEKKLAHSLAMVEKLRERHPQLAEAWQKSVTILENRIAAHG